VSIWYLADAVGVDKAIERFKANYPNVKVDAQKYAADQYKTKLKVALGTPNGPGRLPHLGWRRVQDLRRRRPGRRPRLARRRGRRDRGHLRGGAQDRRVRRQAVRRAGHGGGLDGLVPHGRVRGSWA
jgi:hypothetical protein